MIPTVAHNEALTGDTLYSAFLNHEWRTIVLPYVIRGMAEMAATIEDESERQDFEVLYGAMIDDFYDEDVVMVDGTPLGVIVWYPHWTSTIPEKWLKCFGQTLNVADYPDLAAILDEPFFSGGSTFTLPDLRERFLYGAEFNAELGDVGGADEHTLTIAEIPAHNHSVATRINALGSAAAVATGNTANSSINTGNAGSGNAHNNMPPFMRGYWIIKALP